ncbi:MAG: DUF4139 domain-containing protein [Bacteroidia bacterium]|nr:DUF4139 domain-containing protein [Bacteroidia bacterium]
MKTSCLLLMIALFCQSALADEPVVIVKSKIESVTVYLSGGAQITRTAKVNLNPGNTNVVISGLSQSLDPQSIQAKSSGDFTILSVSNQIDYLTNQPKPEETELLEKSKEDLDHKIAEKNGELEVYNQEEGMLLKNQSLGGQNTGVSVAELKLAADFFRTRLTEIKKLKLELSNSIKKLNEELVKINEQITQLHASTTQPVGEITLLISSESVQNGTISLSYFVPGASWRSLYDIKVKDDSGKINVIRKANVSQATGEKWDNVNLTLTTSNPLQSGNKAELSPWYLAYYQVMQTNYKRPLATTRESMAPSVAQAKPMEKDEESVNFNLPVVEQVENMTSMSFEIKQPYTIPSDSKEYLVIIGDLNVTAQFEYKCSPKLDPDVFLTAQIPAWEDYDLLSGEANLFMQGTYLGKTMINSRVPTDTLSLSLGRDKSVIVERKKIKNYSSKQFLGSDKKVSVAWEINVRNNKKKTIDLMIDDQVPVSTNKDIVVDKSDYSYGKINETTGIITWKMKIDAGKSEKIGFKYSVKYPKNNMIILE